MAKHSKFQQKNIGTISRKLGSDVAEDIRNEYSYGEGEIAAIGISAALMISYDLC
jgi:hypothetical protein